MRLGKTRCAGLQQESVMHSSDGQLLSGTTNPSTILVVLYIFKNEPQMSFSLLSYTRSTFILKMQKAHLETWMGGKMVTESVVGLLGSMWVRNWKKLGLVSRRDNNLKSCFLCTFVHTHGPWFQCSCSTGSMQSSPEAIKQLARLTVLRGTRGGSSERKKM